MIGETAVTTSATNVVPLSMTITASQVWSRESALPVAGSIKTSLPAAGAPNDIPCFLPIPPTAQAARPRMLEGPKGLSPVIVMRCITRRSV